MVRATLALLFLGAVLTGCAFFMDKPDPNSKAVKEFATQKDGVCCYVGHKPIPDEAPPKIDWAGQVADLKSKLGVKESENADLARQLAALKARPTAPDLSGQLADLQAKLSAKESENADLARQLAALREAKDKQASDLARTLAEKGSMTLRGIFFDTGKATLKPESAKDLAAIGQALMDDPSLKLEIQGHTDNVGGEASNLQLSKNRAAGVRDYVVKYFVIAPDRLTTAGFGGSKPVADNKTPEGRALNRRVEVIKK